MNRALCAVAMLCAAATAATARRDDGGCRGSDLSCDELRYYCSLGSQTPISVREFCGRRGDYRGSRRNDYDRRGRYQGLSFEELRYYCSLGDQTPISARQDCIRAGLW